MHYDSLFDHHITIVTDDLYPIPASAGVDGWVARERPYHRAPAAGVPPHDAQDLGDGFPSQGYRKCPKAIDNGSRQETPRNGGGGVSVSDEADSDAAVRWG